MDGHAGGDELGAAGLEIERRIEAGAQIETCGARSCVGRQRELRTHAWIEDPDLEAPPRGGHRGRHAWAESRCVPPAREAAYDSAMRRTSSRANESFVPWPRSRRALRQSTMRWLSSHSNTLLSPTSLAAIMSRFFFSSLARAFCSTDSVSAAKPTTNGRPGRAATVANTSAVRSMLRSRVLAVFLIFWSCGLAGR